MISATVHLQNVNNVCFSTEHRVNKSKKFSHIIRGIVAIRIPQRPLAIRKTFQDD